MGQKTPDPLTAIAEYLHLIDRLSFGCTERRHILGGSASARLNTYRFALRMAITQADGIRRQMVKIRQPATRAQLEQMRLTIERAMVDQFETHIAPIVERLLYHRSADTRADHAAVRRRE